MKYRKKPVVVDAWPAQGLLFAASNDWPRLPEAISAACERGDVIFAANHIAIRTLEGIMRAEPADFVIQGVAGELYPCKPDIFEATYEPARPQAPAIPCKPGFTR